MLALCSRAQTAMQSSADTQALVNVGNARSVAQGLKQLRNLGQSHMCIGRVHGLHAYRHLCSMFDYSNIRTSTDSCAEQWNFRDTCVGMVHAVYISLLGCSR